MPLVGLGIDPGFSRTGFGALVMHDDGRFESLGVRTVKTEKAKGKRFEALRVAMDDARRRNELYDATCQAIEDVKPQVIGVEVYTIFVPPTYTNLRNAAKAYLAAVGGGAASEAELAAHLAKLTTCVEAFKEVRGMGNAAKTYGAYAGVCLAARKYGIPTYEFMPVDLKKRACGQSKASKTDVAKALQRRIEGLEDKVNTQIRAKTMHEHVYDATGHGMLALLEYAQWR